MSCFTPVESTIGGFFIGVSMVSHYLFCGKETNVSSEFATFIKLPQIATNKWWKSLSYLVGLIAGGYLLTVFYPRAFEYKIQIHLSPILYRVTRNGWTIVYAVAGVLVVESVDHMGMEVQMGIALPSLVEHSMIVVHQSSNFGMDL